MAKSNSATPKHPFGIIILSVLQASEALIAGAGGSAAILLRHTFVSFGLSLLAVLLVFAIRWTLDRDSRCYLPLIGIQIGLFCVGVIPFITYTLMLEFVWLPFLILSPMVLLLLAIYRRAYIRRV